MLKTASNIQIGSKKVVGQAVLQSKSMVSHKQYIGNTRMILCLRIAKPVFIRLSRLISFLTTRECVDVENVIKLPDKIKNTGQTVSFSI